MTETVLLSVLQHPIKFYFRMTKWVMLALIAGSVGYLLTEPTLGIVGGVLICTIGFVKERHRHTDSALRISDQRIFLSVRKGLFRSFEIGLHYSQIINCTYVKSNFLHSLTNSGTLFIRASEKPEGQIMAEFVPNVEEVCRMVNLLIPMDETRRRSEFGKIAQKPEPLDSPEDTETRLRDLRWARFVAPLSPSDRSFIFETEEERNHGVFEAIRRTNAVFLICDEDFRRPAAPIMFRTSKRSILPGVPFLETNRPDTVSGSPSAKIHAYLVEKSKLEDASECSSVVVGYE